MKPGEMRVRAEPTPSTQFPFADMPAPDTYKSQAGIEVKKEVGVSISGSTVREEHFQVLHGREAKVGHRLARRVLLPLSHAHAALYQACYGREVVFAETILLFGVY